MPLAVFKKGEVFEGVGITPTNEFYAKFINNIPNLWKQKIYTLGGKVEATLIKSIKKIDAHEIDKWIYNIYPEKQ